MSWCGWTEEQTLATSMQSIESGYRGVHERLCAVAGRDVPGAKIDRTDVPEPRAMTTELFAAIFGGNK